MADTYIYSKDLREQAKVPANGILSQTLQNDERTKVVLFGFAAGQELSAHTAPYPAILTLLKGEATLRLGADQMDPAARARYQGQDRSCAAVDHDQEPIAQVAAAGDSARSRRK
jgi:hypothetical protein